MASYSKRTTTKGTVYDVRFMADVNGTRRLVHLSGYPTKKAAEKAYIEWEDSRKGSQLAVTTFENSVDFYIQSKTGTASQNTLYNLRNVFDKHITGKFAGRLVNSVSKSDVMSWQAELWAAHTPGGSLLTDGTCRQIRGDFSSFMSWASDVYGFDNPFIGVKTPRRREQKKEMVVWSVEDFNRFIGLCEPDFAPFFSLAFYTGAREGELLALYPSDFRRKGDVYEISITKSAQTERKGFDVVTPPKNSASNRTVSLPSALTDMTDRLLASASGTFVFGGERPWSRSKVTAVFVAGIKASGVTRIRIHDLRHSHASILLTLGVPVTEVSRRLGHASVSTTMNIYSHC
ncbi:MAG: tyrosine-type recombinase/integrase, partial [Bacteroidales bacterium]|nr:tyrosine-type recombinase/integrase [Bacteroidales bacterium]